MFKNLLIVVLLYFLKTGGVKFARKIRNQFPKNLQQLKVIN